MGFCLPERIRCIFQRHRHYAGIVEAFRDICQSVEASGEGIHCRKGKALVIADYADRMGRVASSWRGRGRGLIHLIHSVSVGGGNMGPICRTAAIAVDCGRVSLIFTDIIKIARKVCSFLAIHCTADFRKKIPKSPSQERKSVLQ